MIRYMLGGSLRNLRKEKLLTRVYIYNNKKIIRKVYPNWNFYDWTMETREIQKTLVLRKENSRDFDLEYTRNKSAAKLLVSTYSNGFRPWRLRWGGGESRKGREESIYSNSDIFYIFYKGKKRQNRSSILIKSGSFGV